MVICSVKGRHYFRAFGAERRTPPILRTLFQVPYPVSPAFATLVKTPGVWGYSSQFGKPSALTATRSSHFIQVLSFHTLAHSLARAKTQLFSFQAIAHSLPQNTRGGGTSFKSKAYLLVALSPDRVVTSLLHYFVRRSWRERIPGQRANTEVVKPPRGVNSPRTTHHSGFTAATMSRSIRLTAFS